MGELTDNREEQSQLQNEIKHLSDESASDMEIDANAKQVANETASPALAATLGSMWKDMRMFQLPFFAEHTEEEIHHLKRDEKALEAQQRTYKIQLEAAEKEAASAKRAAD